MKPTLTDLEKACLARAIRANGWIIATGNGERVTLASLYRKGLLERHPRRGKEGEASAAYEYRASHMVREAWKEVAAGAGEKKADG